ncbi:hypothetical protein JDV02_008893 [Purpureocillium takamizusanense]|uniref:Uncharacterized protein n=1 Tax=Purpureocillium takamizusanense TaxID=2060973 RepID=A0A9Q8QNN1_9HYPO|nr:uncharacterized protein JDV02_008893 [Purpureocillium takamizusanense]UNI23050.1 hypothetical protein JDV02_008893 [Purpureocillium takamizusanense]
MKHRLAVASLLLLSGGTLGQVMESGHPKPVTSSWSEAFEHCEEYNQIRFGNCDPLTQICIFFDRHVAAKPSTDGTWNIYESGRQAPCAHPDWKCERGACLAGPSPNDDPWCF